MLFFCAFAQERQEIWRFENISSEDGLSNDWVNDITEDYRGFLWLATRSGLNVFDGKNFKKIVNQPNDEKSISHDDVSCVLHHDSTIYAGTWGRGLNLINPLTHEITQVGDDSTLSYLTIKNLTVGPDSNIYVCTYGDGVYKYVPSSGDFTKLKQTLGSEEGVFDFCEAIHFFDGQVWVGLRSDGIGRVNKNGELELIQPDGTSSGTIHHITVINDNGDDLIVGTHFGELFRLDSKSGKVLRKYVMLDEQGVKARVTSIIINRDKRCWVSTSSGLFILDFNTGIKTRVVSDSYVSDYNNEFCSFVDSRGVLWFGSWGSGLEKYYAVSHRFSEINLSNFPKSTKKSIFELDENNLLVGTSFGVVQYDKVLNKAFRPVFHGKGSKNISENVILGFAKYKDKVLVAVDAAGLYLVDTNYHVTEFISINDKLLNHTFINNVNTTSNGDIWIPTWSNGLLHIDPENNDMNHYFHFDNAPGSIDNNLVHCVFESSDGTYWVGTKEGVNSFYKSQRKFKKPNLIIANTEKTYQIKDVKSISEDNSGNLWLASSVGLVRWNRRANETRLFTEENGLVDHDFLGTLVQGDYLWGATKSGLIRLNTSDFSVTNYTKRDGLLSNSFVDNSLNLTSDSTLYLGNGHGMIYFNFNDTKKTEFVDEIYVSDITINRSESYDSKGQHFSNVKEVVVPYEQNSLFIDVLVQSFGLKKTFVFAHKLSGFQEEWVLHKQGQDEVSYTNLPYGEYVLHLSALNGNSQRVGDVRKVKIHVKKPFWRALWFVLLLVLLFIGLLYLFFKWRNKSILSMNALLEKNVTDRTSTLSKKNEELRKAYVDLKTKEESLEQNIQYVSILQNTLKPSGFDLSRSLGEHFIMQRSESMASGDFYWGVKVDSKRIVVVADCTGQGIAGAFLSVIGVTSLRNIIVNKGITNPGAILNGLHEELSSILNIQDNMLSESMSISIVAFDQNTKVLSIASAKSKPVVINSKGEQLVIRGNRFPVGSSILNNKDRESYSSFDIELKDRYMVYLFTDGYQNQFGGYSDEKYYVTNLRKLFSKQYFKKPKDQKKLFEYTFDKWKRDNVLTDDVLLVGLEFEG